MSKICIQAGHENWQYNTIVKGSTGAPGELEFNVSIRNSLAGELRKRGIEVVTTDSCGYNDPNVTKVDFDLFLSIHYDADVYGKGGGMVDFADPASDMATKESQRIAKAITDAYFPKTGIVNHPERSNKNTRFYYMWRYLTAKTPCVLIECGVGQHKPDDYDVLFNHRDLVVEGIGRGVCNALGVKWDIAKTCEEKLADATKQIDQLNANIRGLNDQINTLNGKITGLTNDKATLQGKLDQIKIIISQ